jgi:ubiquinone/menaquinone biosynthesis C-methylase UbiE
MDQIVKAASVASPDFEAIKKKQQATWASGDYAVVGTTLQIVGESLAEEMDIRAGEKVLDVAAGNGNATLAAARRFAQVTSTDYVAGLLEKGAERAKAEGLNVHFQVADVEALPFADGAFDAVISTFGCMFAPNHERTASEMLRVTRSGGRIGMANWTPSSYIGKLFKTLGKYIPPAPGMQPPALWGSDEHLMKLFGGEAAKVQVVRRNFNFRYRSAAHWVQVFREFYGPTHKAFAALDANAQIALERDIVVLLGEHNTGGAASLVVPSEYVEVVITKR